MHMPKLSRLWSAAVVGIAVFAVSCGDSPFEPGESNDRVDITNDEQTLDARVQVLDVELPIDPPSPSAMRSAAYSPAAPQALRLWLLARVDPPEVDGQVVQATSVSLKNSKVMVSYNMRGEPRLGAIDWITRLLPWPRIGTSATFADSDISAISFDGTYVYAAEATGAEGFPYPAVLERLKLEGNNFTLEDNLRVPLTSYVATSTLVTDNEVYATSGNTGHVFAFDRNSLSLLGQYELDDARWVAWDEAGQRVVVAQGTPGRIAVFAEGDFPGGSMNLINTFPFPGANVPESKSTVEIAGGKAFIAAGPEGVQIVCLDDGQVIGSVPRPDPAELGLDPSVVVTNAVTVDEDVMFISNGEAGVYVARGAEDFASSACNTQQINVLGKLQFDDLQSANHIEYRNRWLVVAAGLGGVKLVYATGL